MGGETVTYKGDTLFSLTVAAPICDCLRLTSACEDVAILTETLVLGSLMSRPLAIGRTMEEELPLENCF